MRNKKRKKKKASSSKFQVVWTTYEEKQKEKFRQSHWSSYERGREEDMLSGRDKILYVYLVRDN